MQDTPPDTVFPPLPAPDGTTAVPERPAGLCGRLCFDRGDYALLRIVNDVLSRQGSSSLRRLLTPYLHPHGIKEMAAPKGLRIAYATIHLLGSLEVGLAGDRLAALRSLRDEVMATAESGLEKNTARVLLQIMKELVRARDNPRRQLELAHDFRMAVPGKPRVVRRLLAEYHLLEMPESWDQMAFDDHVHDANTKGRKSPTHLIMDAWIKGIRRLTVIHYHFVRRETAAELLEAAAIMDMDVHIGIECLARFEGRLVKIIWTPRGITRPEEFSEFLAAPGVKEFMRQGFELSLRRQHAILSLLDAFNARHRPALNAQYGVSLAPLDREEFLAFVGAGQASAHHLARFIHESLMPLLDREDATIFEGSGDSDSLTAAMARRNALDTEAIYDTYLSRQVNPDIPWDDTPTSEDPLPERLTITPAALANRIMQLHRLNRITLVAAELSTIEVLSILASCQGGITTLEVFNLRIYEETGRDAGDVLELLAILNNGNVVALKRLIRRLADKLEADGGDPEAVANARELGKAIPILTAAYHKTPLAARIGTDSTGQSTRHHGMGLVVKDTLPSRARRVLAAGSRDRDSQDNQRRTIPVGVVVIPQLRAVAEEFSSPVSSRLFRVLRRLPGLRLAGYRCRLDWLGRRYYKATEQTANIFTLGGMHPKAGDRFLADLEVATRSPRPHWSILNGSLKNTLKILAGFSVAAISFASVNTWWVLAWLGPFLWFGITGVRNVIQSVLGCGGIRHSPLLSWKDFVNGSRLADSLLFTGLSVPLLDILVKTVVMGQGLGITTTSDPLALYTAMAVANGAYLASHNLYRGLPKAAAVGNLFRTVLSIPLAFGINAALLWLVAASGSPSPGEAIQPFAAIVSKFSSDCVAAVIEGLADRSRYMHMRLKDYRAKFKQLFDAYCLLEMRFPQDDATRLLETPKTLMAHLQAEKEDLDKILIVNALDLLYFWMYQPRAQTVLERAVQSMSVEERRVFLLSQYVLLREKEISRLFIEGLVGRKFSQALSFYLSYARPYLEAIRRLVRTNPAVEPLSLENSMIAADSAKPGA